MKPWTDVRHEILKDGKEISEQPIVISETIESQSKGQTEERLTTLPQ